MFAENFEDEGGFLVVFEVPSKNLPRGGAEITGVFRIDTVHRGMSDFGGDGFVIMRFAFGDLIVDDLFTWKRVPEKDFTAIRMSAESLATWDDFKNLTHMVNYSTVDK